ncbi:MFS transporter [Oligoflexaceae bacterium]|nr:MFS transporter [Oligoflexaceae bacterium]
MNKPLILRNRDFLLLWTSQVLSQAGNRMFQIAVSWWIISQVSESSGLYLAIFMVLGALPAIILVKKIGMVVDRYSSRQVLLTSDVLGGIFACLLIASMMGEPVFSLILISGMIFAFFQGFIEPTLNKAVPELVDEVDIGPAVAFLSSTQTLANFAGAVLGAIFIEEFGLIGVTLINGGSYLFSAVCDSLIRFRQAPKSKEEAGESGRLSGWALLKDKPLIKKILITFGCVNLFGTPILVILPLYTKHVLKASASVLGGLEACVWVGILLGTFGTSLFGLKNKTFLFTGLCLSTFALFLSLPGFGAEVAFYGFCLFGAGFSLGAMNVRIVSFFQMVIANEHKGRFFSLLQALISFAIPIGYFGFAYLSDFIAIQKLCFIQGAGVAILALVFIYYSRDESALRSYIKAEGEKS